MYFQKISVPSPQKGVFLRPPPPGNYNLPVTRRGLPTGSYGIQIKWLLFSFLFTNTNNNTADNRTILIQINQLIKMTWSLVKKTYQNLGITINGLSNHITNV